MVIIQILLHMLVNYAMSHFLKNALNAQILRVRDALLDIFYLLLKVIALKIAMWQIIVIIFFVLF